MSDDALPPAPAAAPAPAVAPAVAPVAPVFERKAALDTQGSTREGSPSPDNSTPSPSREPLKTPGKWQKAAFQVNPKLDNAKLNDISSKRLSKANSSDTTISMMELAHSLTALMYPSDKKFQGGEGIEAIVNAREHDFEFLPFLKDKYWSRTLFAVTGRALPLLQLLIYVCYVCIVVITMHYKLPNYANSVELKGLQFPTTTLGTALFLLMSFRTNSSYDRWWEGRKLWDAITCKCLDMGRVAQGWVAPKSPAVANELVRMTIAYSVIVKKYLRQDWKVLDELHGLIRKPVVDKLEKEYNPVLAVSVLLTRAVEEAGKLVPAPVLAGLENQVRAMIADALACNRIFYTPMPFAYVVHLRSFMVLWLMVLPFAFLPSLGPWTMLVCAVVGYQLLGFEDIGVEIESPFGHDFNDLPVDKLQAIIFNNLIKVLSNITENAEPAAAVN